jgi:general secretion pathway protein B
MSFILDALKKLEQKRNRDAIPDLLTVHSSPIEKPPKRLVWPFIIVIALLMNAAVFFAWLKPWQSEKPGAASQPSFEQPEPASSATADNNPDAVKPAQSPAVIEKTAESTVPVSDTVVSSPESAPDTEHATQNSSASKESIDAVKTLPAAVEPDTKTPSARPGPSGTHIFLPDEEELATLRGKIKEEIDYSASAPSHESASSVHSGPDLSSQEVIEMSQLPSDIKNELPRISINAHIYSNNPSSRVVNINGVVLREGEDVARGLTLKKITTSGVILTYKEHHFRIRAF